MLVSQVLRNILLVLVCSAVVATAAAAQTPSPEWVWINGNKPSLTSFSTGHQGEMGVPGFSYSPMGRFAATQWVDSGGNLWLFGGYGIDKTWRFGDMNDLWMFNPTTDEWTWVGGSLSACGVGSPNGHYGTKGVADSSNQPPKREDAIYWTDKSGKFWLFGGSTACNSPGPVSLNDLWMFNPSSQLWTWEGGSQTPGANPVYGTIGTAASTNTPGSMHGAQAWVDGTGTVWMYGGLRDSTPANPWVAELWKLNFSTGEWTCVQKTPPSGSPNPLGRYGAATWVGADGKLWLYGGSSGNGPYSEMWKLDPKAASWTLVKGSGSLDSAGVYGPKGSFSSSNLPPARIYAQSWVDHAGNLWVLGGQNDQAGFQWQGLDDLWEWSSSLQKWAWMGGDKLAGFGSPSAASWGVHRLPAPANYPGGRLQAAAWYDGARAWVFGGDNTFADAGSPQNDLWEFAPVTPAPQFNPGHGSSKLPQAVTITDANPDAIIYYTTDGTVPTPVNGNVYSGPVQVTDATHRVTILKAVAAAPGMAQSGEVFATYKLWPVN